MIQLPIEGIVQLLILLVPPESRRVWKLVVSTEGLSPYQVVPTWKVTVGDHHHDDHDDVGWFGSSSNVGPGASRNLQTWRRASPSVRVSKFHTRAGNYLMCTERPGIPACSGQPSMVASAGGTDRDLAYPQFAKIADIQYYRVLNIIKLNILIFYNAL